MNTAGTVLWAMEKKVFLKIMNGNLDSKEQKANANLGSSAKGNFRAMRVAQKNSATVWVC